MSFFIEDLQLNFHSFLGFQHGIMMMMMMMLMMMMMMMMMNCLCGMIDRR